MTKIKLTKTALERMHAPHPSGKQKLVWDTELKGFGVLLSGTTTARTYVVQRRLPDGRDRRVTVAGVAEWEAAGKTVDEARAEAGRLLLDIRAGRDPKARRREDMTVRRALDEYLEAGDARLRQRSKDGMRSTAQRYLAKWFNVPLSQITPDMVEEHHRSIQRDIASREVARQIAAAKQAERCAKPRRPRPPEDHHTIKRTGHHSADGAMRTLRALWNFAAERDPTMHALANPVRRLRRVWKKPEDTSRDRRVHSEQLPAFYSAVQALENTTARDYLLLLLFTGMRREEAASLKWSDVDLVELIIRVRRAHTKGDRKLDLPMSDLVRDLFIARRAVGTEGDYVFPGDGKNGYIAEPRYPLLEVFEATGIYVSAHDLRRTFIGIAEATDMSAYALKALVNHSKGRDQTSSYLGLTVERLREPAQRVADRIKTLCAIQPISGDKVKRLRR